MYWGDWAAPATLSLSRFEDASLLFQTYYGDVIAEAGRWIYYFFMFDVLQNVYSEGKPQEFACELSFNGDNETGE